MAKMNGVESTAQNADGFIHQTIAGTRGIKGADDLAGTLIEMLISNMAITQDHEFLGSQALNPYRTAGMKLVGADADLGA